MSAKKSSSEKSERLERLEDLFLLICPISPYANKLVVEGVESVYRWIKENPLCTMNSTKLSLKKKVREQVDIAYKSFAESAKLPVVDLSQSIASDPSKFLSDLDRAFKEYRGLSDLVSHNANEDKELFFNELTTTIDVIKDLVFVCSLLSGRDIKVVELTDNILGIKRGKKSSPTKPKNISVHRNFNNSGNLCEYCSRFTERATEILRAAKGEIFDSENGASKELIRTGAPVQISEYSARFCSNHSPTQSPIQYQSALKKINLYHAMRLFLIICRQITHNDAGGIVLMRALSFAVVDALAGMKLHKGIPNLVDRYVATGSHESSDKEMLNCCTQIINKLHERNEQLASILFDLFIEKKDMQDDVYKRAVEAEIIPQTVDDNLLFAAQNFAQMIFAQGGERVPHPLLKSEGGK